MFKNMYACQLMKEAAIRNDIFNMQDEEAMLLIAGLIEDQIKSDPDLSHFYLKREMDKFFYKCRP